MSVIVVLKHDPIVIYIMSVAVELCFFLAVTLVVSLSGYAFTPGSGCIYLLLIILTDTISVGDGGLDPAMIACCSIVLLCKFTNLLETSHQSIVVVQ